MEKEIKRYLITGGAGFIGSHFVRGLLGRHEDALVVNLDKLTYAGDLANLDGLEDDPRHIFVRGDICDKKLLAGLFERYEFDFVVNFAAESHVDRSIADADIFARTNVLGTLNLLDCAREAWYDPAAGAWKSGKKFIQISTDEVYGAQDSGGYFTETSPLCPRNPYAASKAGADHFVTAFRDTYGMPVNITRSANNYGPRQYPEKLIPLVIARARDHKKLPIYGDGEQIRDWLYVEDNCRAIDLVVHRGTPGEIYNISGNDERVNIEVVRAILAQLRGKLRDDAIGEGLIEYVKDRPGHDRRYGLDSGKLGSRLGWKPETPFEKGLELTIDWYLER